MINIKVKRADLKVDVIEVSGFENITNDRLEYIEQALEEIFYVTLLDNINTIIKDE